MIIERINNEILIRIPDSVDIDGIQRAINYIRYKELSSASKAKQEDIDKLAEEINRNWWEVNKNRLLKWNELRQAGTSSKPYPEKQTILNSVKIIVDTNIVFSALLNTNSIIGDLLLNSANIFEFYSCQYLWYEIINTDES